jgi:hypothetical protein
MLGGDGLKIAVERSKVIFAALRKKYPEMGAYLVFSSRQGQCSLTLDPMTILKEFPDMVCEHPSKTELLKLLEAIKQAEAERRRCESKVSPKELQKMGEALTQKEQKVQELVKKLRFCGDTQIELRFETLRYALIDRMRLDPLIDQVLTPPPEIGSIRIVLGSLTKLSAE